MNLRERNTVIHRLQEALREALRNDELTNPDRICPPAIRDKFDAMSVNEVITQAQAEANGTKNGSSACQYLFYKCIGVVKDQFWQYVGRYGNNAKAKISDDAWEEWISNAYLALTTGFEVPRGKLGKVSSQVVSALRNYDQSKVKIDTYAAFANFYKRELNRMGEMLKFSDRMKVSNEDNLFSQEEENQDATGGGHASRNNKGDLAAFESGIYASTEDSGTPMFEDLEAWKDFCLDDDLLETRGGCSVGKALKTVLQIEAIEQNENDKHSVKELTQSLLDKVGCSASTLRNLAHDAMMLLNDYDLNVNTIRGLMEVYGPEKIASYLAIAE